MIRSDRMPVKPAGGMGTLSSKLVNSLNVKGIDMICVANQHPQIHTRQTSHTRQAAVKRRLEAQA